MSGENGGFDDDANEVNDGCGGRDGGADGASDGNEARAESTAAEWPVQLSGVTESVVTTLGPNGLWNAAALGLFADDGDSTGAGTGTATPTVTARTWGNTRTRRNFHRQGEGYVQFVDDPVVFADAALTIYELEEPVLDAAAAWVRVTVAQIDSGTDDGTTWEEWALEPVEAEIERETVPTIDRGFGTVIEATVAASRLGVPGYDDAELRDRLEFYASVVDRAGGPRERRAIERVRENSDW